MNYKVKFKLGTAPDEFKEEDYVFRGKSGLWFAFSRIPKDGKGSKLEISPWAKYILKNGQVRIFGPQQRKV